MLGVFVFNWIENSLETWVGSNFDLVSGFRYQTANAAQWLEGNSVFDYHDVTNDVAMYGYSSAYFFLFPALFLVVAFALAARQDIRSFRVLSLAAMLDYALSLPFFILFPVPERWAYSESGAMLLSDRWTAQFIELIRPISGLDNSFPSFHVSLTLIIIIVSFLFRIRLRRTILALGSTVILSTYVLGIHWITDIVAGLAVGALSVMLAIRLDQRLFGLPLREAFSGSGGYR